MPRFSISLVMPIVALAAANCGLIRLVVPFVSELGYAAIRLLGLLPLIDAHSITLYGMVTTRYHLFSRRRTIEERIGFLPVYAAVNAVLLVGLIIACVFATEPVVPILGGRDAIILAGDPRAGGEDGWRDFIRVATL